MSTRPKTTIAAMLTGVALLGAPGCGSDSTHGNELRPASPISVSATVSPRA